MFTFLYFSFCLVGDWTTRAVKADIISIQHNIYVNADNPVA